ncbi:MAG: hydrogenase maturation protease [Actinobacteria bacterium]|nr:hydrogenase maturation protease [Actinomycetota bacterium]
MTGAVPGRSRVRREPQETSSQVAVIGFGNVFMGDDGVGVEVVEKLEAGNIDREVEFVIGGAASMANIRYFLKSRLVIVVDAIAAGARPGDIFRFHPDEAGVTGLRSNNIHGMGVGYLLTTARLRGACPEVIIFGIQVGDVRPNDRQLTPAVAAAAGRVQALVLEEIRSWHKQWRRNVGPAASSSNKAKGARHDDLPRSF